MIKGGNAFVPTVPLRIAVRGGVDVTALLLTEAGRVRGDGDVVFHGAPVHPSGAVRLAGAGAGEDDGTGWLEVGLTAVEAEVARVLVVGSTESGAMRDARGLSVEAFAPDGTSVARYDVTEAGGETAMVLAELYRRAGGWKFRAVGQGYVNGLAGLATDHGVEVAEEAAGPVPVPVAKVPAPEATVPAPVPVSAPVPQPVPAPDPRLTDWTFGGVFEPYTKTGRNNDVITVEGLPPGPVVVDLAVEGEGYTGLWPLNRSNKEGQSLINSTEDNFRGRVLPIVPEDGLLRLRLRADGPWRLQVLPLAAARRLTEETLECFGPDVLLHTGGTADLALHYRGSSNFIIYVYELAEHDDPTTIPETRSAVNEIGRRRETLPLPEGPVVVHLKSADGPWRGRLKRVQPHSRESSYGAVPRLPETRKVQGWLRRSSR